MKIENIKSTENEEMSDFFINEMIQHHEDKGNLGCFCCGDEAFFNFLRAIGLAEIILNASQEVIESLLLFTSKYMYDDYIAKAFKQLIKDRKFQWSDNAILAINKMMGEAIGREDRIKDNIKSQVKELRKEIEEMRIEMEKKIKDLEKEDDALNKLNKSDVEDVIFWKSIV